MSTVTLYASKSAQVDYYNQSANYSSATISDEITLDLKPLLIGFNVPSEYLYKSIITAEIYIKLKAASSKMSTMAYITPVIGDWAENTVTYKTKPSKYGSCYISTSFASTEGDKYFEFSAGKYATDVLKVTDILKYGLEVDGNADTTTIGSPLAYTSRATDKPYIVVTYSSNAYLYPTGAAPQSGYIPKYSDNTFTWGYLKQGICVGNLSVSKYKFVWRTASGGTETTIDCGTTASYTIPANTFTTDSIQWKVTLTDNNGTTNSTDWYTLSTVEATSTAECVSPSNTIVDTSIDNTFTWKHIISTGTNAAKSELQVSDDNSTWEALATVSGSSLSTTILANTLTTSSKYWRVRTYNTDNVAGEWSESASFIALGSPSLDGVSVDATPRPTVKWQSADMQGYQVVIDGYDSGIQYGVIYSYKSPIYLEDGEHTAKVRVINQYGLWSDWQNVSFNITNEARTGIELIATAIEGIVSLSWSADSSFNAFIVERDDVMIAKVTETTYQDNFSIGAHSYAIRGIYDSSDNYSLSDTEYVDIRVDDPIICNVDALDWINLRLSSKSINEIAFGLTTESNTRFYSASINPVAEISKHRTNTINGYVAFENYSDCCAFESLIGTIVCLKLKSGEQIIGLLTGQERTTNTFFTEYRFNITETDFDEEIEL